MGPGRNDQCPGGHAVGGADGMAFDGGIRRLGHRAGGGPFDRRRRYTRLLVAFDRRRRRAGASASADGGASGHSVDADGNTADTSASTHAGVDGSDLGAADSATDANVDSNGIATADGFLISFGIGESAGAASASTTRDDGNTTATAGVSGTSVGDGRADGHAVVVAAPSSPRMARPLSTDVAVEGSTLVVTNGGGTMTGTVNVESAGASASTGTDGAASASSSASLDLSATSTGDGAATSIGQMESRRLRLGRYDRPDRQRRGVGHRRCTADSEGANSSASAIGLGNAAAEAGIDGNTAAASAAANPAIDVSSP